MDFTPTPGKADLTAVVERVTAALKSEGFGVLTDIDVEATRKSKLVPASGNASGKGAAMHVRRSTVSAAVFAVFAAVAVFFFITEHHAHAFGLLPHVLLLVCVALLYVAGVGDRAGEPDGHPSDSHRPPEPQQPTQGDRP